MSITATPSNPSLGNARTGALMAMASMLCVQIGLAVSVGLIGQLGAEGAAWLRLVWAGVLMLLIGRPRRSDFSRTGLLSSVLLGIVIAGLTLLFMAGGARLPPGTPRAPGVLRPPGGARARRP